MTIKFKKNKNTLCCSDTEIVIVGPEHTEPVSGPFDTCEKCPYASHGFICFSSPDDCMRTQILKNSKRRKLCD
ncbi:MAG: hypothetical protein R3Y09_07780 [Clostridia bacterium]